MGETSESIEAFYLEAFRHYDRSQVTPLISLEFYPYIGINHTIRIRNGRAYIRIATICRDMPLPAHRALAFILVSKLYRRRASKAIRAVYEEYVKSDEVRERSSASRRERGRKFLSAMKGRIYDLEEIFDGLNAKYFSRTIPKPKLSWSQRKTFRVLGHHDATHDTIVISQSLDSLETPRYVIEFVMFHEMLHIFHPTVHANGRRFNHTPAFRRDERKFSHFDQAERWIENNVRRLKRSAAKG